jgi:uncharacterized membrane protein YvbJ
LWSKKGVDAVLVRCPKCNYENREANKFCANCGALLRESEISFSLSLPPILKSGAPDRAKAAGKIIAAIIIFSIIAGVIWWWWTKF